MKVVVTGGGTGGHVTPLKPVIHELKKLDPGVEIIFIAQKNDRFADLIEEESEVDVKTFIRAGKYRRYPDEPLLKRLFDFRTHLLNMRDIFRIIGAIYKSYRILQKHRPDVVFGNGGYVSVPVGWAAHRLGIPLVIHESDARPGVATKLLTKRASKILFGVPTETTTLAGKPVQYVGIPLREAFTKKEKLTKTEIKKKLGFDPGRPLTTISGSSLGAEAINSAVIGSFDHLLEQTQIAHITGETHAESTREALDDKADAEGYQLIGFANNIDMLFKASDVVVNRASATIFTELAALGTPTILIPAPQLSDQLENAEILGRRGVVEVIDQHKLEENPELLAHRLTELINDTKERTRLSKAIRELAKPKAAFDVAEILMSYQKDGSSE